MTLVAAYIAAGLQGMIYSYLKCIYSFTAILKRRRIFLLLMTRVSHPSGNLKTNWLCRIVNHCYCHTAIAARFIYLHITYLSRLLSQFTSLYLCHKEDAVQIMNTVLYLAEMSPLLDTLDKNLALLDVWLQHTSFCSYLQLLYKCMILGYYSWIMY